MKKLQLQDVSCFKIKPLILALALLIGMPNIVSANPEGGTVVAGNAQITNDNNNLIINQQTAKAIIDWNSFSIGSNERTQFIQPSASSIILNRVTGNTPSNILGQLTANGQVVILNPAGIIFGSGARVDVAGLIASTADISNSDFMAGRYKFTSSNSANGISILSGAKISIADNGLAVFVAPNVSNQGLIQANLGKVVLASGQAFTLLDLYGDQLINFSLDEGNAGSAAKNSVVSNSGNIIAKGGSVLLTANAASKIVNSQINMDGVIAARSAYKTKTGAIVLDGGALGTTNVSGKLDVSSKYAEAGSIKVLGQHVNLKNNAKLNANGATGGGTILVGGNYHGNGPEQNAQTTTVAQGVTISANATQKGNGGKVVVWSNDDTEYYGNISAKGGALGGNGGSAEVSGKYYLNYAGATNLTAIKGATGNLLLDPYDLQIVAGNTDSNVTIQNTNVPYSVTSNTNGSSQISVNTLLNNLSNANLIIQTGGSASVGSDAGNLTVGTSFDLTNYTNTLTLQAYKNIIFSNNAVITKNSGAGDLNLRADSTGTGVGTVTFGTGAGVNFTGSSGNVNIYYNPTSYTAPTNFSSKVTLGTGALTSYMLVNNITNLANIKNNVAGIYALGTSFNASSNTNFAPIVNFSGVLNGLNNTISGLTINSTATGSLGLFSSTTATAKINNLNLSNVSISTSGATTSSNGVGSLVGINAAGATINNVRVLSGTVTTAGQNTGGLVGINRGVISNSSNNAAVKGVTNVGGVAGANVTNVASSIASIGNSNNTGSVTGTTNVGGLIGKNSATTILSGTLYSNNTVTGTTYVGGLIGSNDASISVNSGNAIYSDSTVTGTTYVGGLIGLNTAALTGLANANVLYADGDVTGAANVGGLVGLQNGGSLSYVSYDGTVTSTNVTTSAGQVGGLVGNNQNATITNSNSAGSVIGGTLNGGLVGNNIKSSIVNSFSTANVSTSSILTMNNGIGGLVGYNSTGTLIQNSYSTGNVSANNRVGGLVGANFGQIQDSYSTGNVSGVNQVGGLVGRQEVGSSAAIPTQPVISNSWSSGNVIGTTGSSMVGGLVGFNRGGSIDSSYATTGLVSGDTNIGGLVGQNIDITVGTAGTLFKGTISNSYSTNSVQGINNVGGLVGDNQSIITDSHSTANVSATSVGANNIGGLIGYNEATASIGGTLYSMANTVTGISNVGGLIGNNAGTIIVTNGNNIYSKNTVSGNMNVGGLIGLNSASLTGLSTLSPSLYSSSNVAGNNAVGGLVGNNDVAATIGNAYSIGLVQGTSQVGGLVGINSGAVDIAYSTANVTGNTDVGGFVGLNNSSGNISNTYSTGVVKGFSTNISNMGGLVGNNAGAINNSFTISNVNQGKARSTIGGLVGKAQSTASVTNSFWDTAVTGQAKSAGGIGLSTYDMAHINKYQAAGWDISDNNTIAIWYIENGHSYPTLNFNRAIIPVNPVAPVKPSKPLKQIIPMPVMPADNAIINILSATNESNYAPAVDFTKQGTQIYICNYTSTDLNSPCYLFSNKNDWQDK